ncbi:DUF5713 family protein [Streptomyces sp. enrichment culture]|uniref:DUF5713 family protein n=1 Tax=Streptomyces sp. enrichment culture TaxID=1795815 RepID=UPI003F54410D
MPVTGQRAAARPLRRGRYGYRPGHPVDRGGTAAAVRVRRGGGTRRRGGAARAGTRGREEAFGEAGSGIGTVVREPTAEDFRFIARACGFPGADVEELSAPGSGGRRPPRPPAGRRTGRPVRPVRPVSVSPARPAPRSRWPTGA